MKQKYHSKILGMGLTLAALFLLLLLSFTLRWAMGMFGNIGFEEVVFHLNMPLEGTSDEIMGSFYRFALLPAAILFAGSLIWVLFPAKYRLWLRLQVGSHRAKISLFPLRLPGRIVAALLALWLFVLLAAANHSFGLVSYIASQTQNSTFIQEQYVDPATATIAAPAQKRNLICIYVESAETTNQDTANGGLFPVNYIPEMTDLARENVSFSQSELLEGAAVAPACGWTIAGLVAETSGLPLKLVQTTEQKVDNDEVGLDETMSDYDRFMPGATALGDILAANGYKNVFMAGSDFAFGGRTKYFAQHGDYEIWDYYTAIEEGKIPSDYYQWWGFEDGKLYTFAKEKLLELAAGDQPFNFSMLTADTHFPNGYTCPLCPNTFDTAYGNVWACTAKQLSGFVAWCQEQDFYKDTTIVICGDHASMDVDFYAGVTADDSYDKHNGSTNRKVYNAFINPAVQPENEKNRAFTTLDIFPSVLAGLGFEIEGDRLGLGTNLFGSRQTLAEEVGYTTLFDALSRRSIFYNQEILYSF